MTASAPSPTYVCQRCFSQTAVLGKKGGKDEKKTRRGAAAREEQEAEEEEAPKSGKGRAKEKAAQTPDFDYDAAFDLKEIEDEYARIDERFEKRLQEFKVGGRFNPEMLGQLQVKPDKNLPESYPLRELAQVVHRGGRSVSIMVSDQAYIKPIMSAVQGSAEFNQQPQRDPDNDLELVLKIEAENPEEQQKRLKGECNSWKDNVREVLSTRKTKHAAWLKAKHITKDDVKNLDKKVKAMQDKKIEVVERREKLLLQELANKQRRL
ncbi:ribosome-recycling factor [Cytospora paraplurivora]|uniref:Ribosome-recycling factor n=1 Tax=Cytospora paraplurivora TaxID=2898453 RepID=A0AAN9YG55_9PEZI